MPLIITVMNDSLNIYACEVTVFVYESCSSVLILTEGSKIISHLAKWLRLYTTGRNVVGSRPDVVNGTYNYT
jgi:hypothetical protein